MSPSFAKVAGKVRISFAAVQRHEALDHRPEGAERRREHFLNGLLLDAIIAGGAAQRMCRTGRCREVIAPDEPA